jgi:hypothetical protein
MSQSSDAYDGRCPECGHVFTLADLARMAVGDGWERYLWARLPDGREALVSFGDFDPATMVALAEVKQRTSTS